MSYINRIWGSSLSFDTLLTSADGAVFDVAGIAETEIRARADSVEARRVASRNASESIKAVQGVAGTAGAFIWSTG